MWRFVNNDKGNSKMSIKDKITSELKNAIMESIKKTIESGNEHGFLMCTDKDGKLYPSREKCEGDSCGMDVGLSPRLCPKKKIQGLFHVHPNIPEIEKFLGRKFLKDDIKNMSVVDKKGNIGALYSPSQRDVSMILLTKCDKLTEGTVCTATDANPDKIECWTPRIGAANFATCYYIKRYSILEKDKAILPKMWIRPLFKREVIDLRDIH
jgi:hypothetical protein